MVSRNEIVYDIFEQLRKHISDDDAIDVRQLEVWVKDYRAEMLKQRFDKNPFNIEDTFIQYLPELDVEKVDSSSVTGLTSGRYLMKITKAIPATIRRKGYTGTLLHIGSSDKLNHSFTITDYATAIDSGNGRFNRDEIFAFPYNGYIYLYSKGDVTKTIYHVDIQGVFEDPKEAYLVTQASSVYTGDENFYTSRDIKKAIVVSILKDKYGINVNPPVDNTDDGMHELEGTTVKHRR